MFTNKSDIKVLEEMVLDERSLCTVLESGNPFFQNQDISLAKDDFGIKDSQAICNLIGTSVDNRIKDIFNESLNHSLERAKKNPSNPALLNSLGKEYLKLGKIDSAIEEFEQALRLRQNYLPAIANLANCYLKKKELDKAIEIYQKIEDMGGIDYKFLTNLALLYFLKGDFDSALNYFQKALNNQKENYHILNNIGLTFLAKKDCSSAIKYIRKASKICKNDYKIYNNLGVCYIGSNSIQQALKNFKIAYSLNKAARDVNLNLNNLYQQTRDFESSISLAENFLAIFPNDLEFINSLSWSYFNLGFHKKCINILKKAILITGIDDIENKSKFHNNLGVVYEKLREFGRAENYYIKSIDFKTYRNPINYYNLIQFYLDLEKYENSFKILKFANNLYPKDINLRKLEARYYLRNNEYKKAKDIYYELISSGHDTIDIYIDLSSIEIDVYNDSQKVFDLLEKAITKFPNSKALLNNYAYCNLQLNNISKAKKLIEGLNCDDSFYLCATKGLLCLKEGNIEDGRKLYNKAINLAQNPDLKAKIYQKKYLEIGKYFLELGQKEDAIRNFKKGLKKKSKETYFQEQLKKLVIEN